MPSATDILAGLSEVANRAVGIAVAWHIAIGVALVAIAKGWRPSERAARTLIGLLPTSVAVLAFRFDNPFNGMVSAASAIALTALAVGGDRRSVSRGPWSISAIGVATIAFAWVYPHFLDAHRTAYLYAAPVGLLPCPTLAAAIGFALLGNGLGVRAWSLTLAAVGLFYGLFGVLRLGVLLDVGLIGGATALVTTAFPLPRVRRTGTTVAAHRSSRSAGSSG